MNAQEACLEIQVNIIFVWQISKYPTLKLKNYHQWTDGDILFKEFYLCPF